MSNDINGVASPVAAAKPKLFSFTGRIGRLRFFLGNLILRLIAVIGAIVIAAVSFAASMASVVLWLSSVSSSTAPSVGGYVGSLLIGVVPVLVWTIVMAILIISYSVRRFHDLDRSGWWVLAGLIPVYNIYLGLGLLLQAGTEGPNRYGNDPLPGADRNGFVARLGASAVFKWVAAVILSILALYGMVAAIRQRMNESYRYQPAAAGSAATSTAQAAWTSYCYSFVDSSSSPSAEGAFAFAEPPFLSIKNGANWLNDQDGDELNFFAAFDGRSLQQIAQGSSAKETVEKTFETKSGLEGEELVGTDPRWRLFRIAGTFNGRQIVATLDFFKAQPSSALDFNAAEAIADSVVIPSSSLVACQASL